jgi:hypothetical protein
MFPMPTLSRTLVSITRAAWKASAATLRSNGVGKVHPDWATRAEACERCAMRVIACNRSYCGQPFKRMPVRNVAVDGCGCPTREKARDPAEHCPLTSDHVAAAGVDGPPDGACNCKWCRPLVSLRVLPHAAN